MLLWRLAEALRPEEEALRPEEVEGWLLGKRPPGRSASRSSQDVEMEGWLLRMAVESLITMEKEQRPVDLCVAAGVLVAEVRRRLRIGDAEGVEGLLDVAQKFMEGGEATIERARTLADIAQALEEKGDMEKALERVGDVLAICKEMKNTVGELDTNVRMASLEVRLHHLDRAFERLNGIYDRLLQSAPPSTVCLAEWMLGPLLWQRGEREEALRLLRRAAEGYAKLGETGMAKLSAGMAANFEKQASPINGSAPVDPAVR